MNIEIVCNKRARGTKERPRLWLVKVNGRVVNCFLLKRRALRLKRDIIARRTPVVYPRLSYGAGRLPV